MNYTSAVSIIPGGCPQFLDCRLDAKSLGRFWAYFREIPQTGESAIASARRQVELVPVPLDDTGQPGDYDYKIEYLKFEEGTPFPEVLHRCPHVAYKVDSLEKYIADADSVICGPMQANDQGDQLAFVWKDGAILELYQPK